MSAHSTTTVIKRILLLTLLVFTLPHLCNAQNLFESVVQIEVNGKKRGVGVVTNKIDHVVTALHVVAGQRNIRVYSKARGRSVPATIHKVHQESDLALLTLDTPLQLPAIKVSNEVPNARNDYFIYGYTKTPEVKESNMDVSSNFFKLTSIIAPSTPQHKWLVDNGFPLPSATIIRLDSPIQHGDSGSPILNYDGQLVGIADGGLKKGMVRMNWGISSAEYIHQLFNSNENPKNIKPSTVPFLKNARSENSLFNVQGDMNLYHIFSDYLNNIYYTAFPEDQSAINAYRNSALQLSDRDILDQAIDVYEDYDTGATIGVPQGLDFEYNPSTGLLRAWSPSGNVEMNILIKETNSFNEAYSRVANFKNDLFMGATWYERVTGNTEIYEPYNQFYDESINCTQYNQFNEERSSLIAEILIDGSYVLATSVTVYDTAKAYANPIDWYYTYAMEACLQLCGFPIY